MRLSGIIVTTALVVGAAVNAGGAQASEHRAAEPSGSPTAAVEPVVGAEEYEALYEALVAGGGTVDADGAVTHDVEGFGAVTLGRPPAEDDVRPLLGGGWSGLSGPYVSLNRTDQSALLAGGGAALAGAICLIPAVGQAACVGAAAIVAVAGVYLNEYGRCPTSKPNLRVYVWDRSKIGCYS